jgi:hypothetical protein
VKCKDQIKILFGGNPSSDFRIQYPGARVNRDLVRLQSKCRLLFIRFCRLLGLGSLELAYRQVSWDPHEILSGTKTAFRSIRTGNSFQVCVCPGAVEGSGENRMRMPERSPWTSFFIGDDVVPVIRIRLSDKSMMTRVLNTRIHPLRQAQESLRQAQGEWRTLLRIAFFRSW